MTATVKKNCEGCGQGFRVDEAHAWQRLCYSCWRSVNATAVEIKQLKAENAVLRAELTRARTLPRLSAPRFDAQRWRQLVSLCHPDRHGNSPASNEATAWLLKMRKEMDS